MAAFPYRLVFLRHGETAFNAENRLQGQLDIPLSARGRDQARAVGKALSARLPTEIDRLEETQAFVSSPLSRARETMEIARAEMGLDPAGYRQDAALKELSFGAWQGLTWAEIAVRDRKGLAERQRNKWAFAPPGGESYAMLAERVSAWLASLTAEALVVSHGGVARVIMTLVAGLPAEIAIGTPITQGRALMMENGSWRWID